MRVLTNLKYLDYGKIDDVVISGHRLGTMRLNHLSFRMNMLQKQSS